MRKLMRRGRRYAAVSSMRSMWMISAPTKTSADQ